MTHWALIQKPIQYLLTIVRQFCGLQSPLPDFRRQLAVVAFYAAGLGPWISNQSQAVSEYLRNTELGKSTRGLSPYELYMEFTNTQGNGLPHFIINCFVILRCQHQLNTSDQMATSAQLSVIIDDSNDNYFKYSPDSLLIDPPPAAYYYLNSAHFAATTINSADPTFVEITFEGTSISIFGNTSAPGRSDQFTVAIDGGVPYTTTYGDPSPPSTRQWYQSPVLSEDLHHITLSNVAGAILDFAVISTTLSTDAVAEAAGSLIFDDVNPIIGYTGSGWTESSETHLLLSSNPESTFVPYGNSTHQTSTVGDSFNYTFIGGGTLGLSVYGILDSTRLGSLQIDFVLDDENHFSFDSEISTLDENFIRGLIEPNFPYFETPNDLPLGQHTLVATVTGCQNQVFTVDYITLAPVGATETAHATASSSPDPLETAVPASASALASGSVSGSSSKARIGAIAGGVVGGVALLVLAGVALNFWRRKARRPANTFMYPFRYGAFWNTNLNTITVSRNIPLTTISSLPTENLNAEKV
ncbi:hypothetical protein HYPSUDRAFT_38077 [Hypholoma sublateritium FD-334 SS-4]|uniref:Uncharacterized protein n=1 Tax=Hypholoma sublateritium (strain FD-334 SS-4) TaxID=945553 RepID=A0A0D2P975_HYPSF|nr:hypothetical protein HYPSUDRAFT_38077 [Hypholoma sublateritium FD-334 SS-4]